MIDFHSHILPGVDDGATDYAMSVKMLKDSYSVGVKTVISTSHCYPETESDIDYFLSKRAESFENLQRALKHEQNVPNIVLGCEVNISTDLAELKNIKKLCLPNTNYLLVEMPQNTWEEWMVDSVYNLTLLGIRPIIAHIDRYLSHNYELFESLSELEVLFQVNSDAFISKNAKKILEYLIASGHFHVLGSDMHNTTTRQSSIGKASSMLAKRCGEDILKQLETNSNDILNNEEITHYFLKTKKRKLFF